MAPSKKREKEVMGDSTSSGTNYNNVNSGRDCNRNINQQEQELFLQAFEKPTQIYRLLRNRQFTSPMFLYRTLTYMKDRVVRTHKNRTNFKVDSILKTVSCELEPIPVRYVNILFESLIHNNQRQTNWNSDQKVEINVSLFKITKSKRKDSTSDFKEHMAYKSYVVCNPKEPVQKYPAVCLPISYDDLLPDQNTIFKLCLFFKISEINSNKDENKRDDETSISIGSEILLINHNMTIIPNGQYESILQELNPAIFKTFSPKKRTWAVLPNFDSTILHKYNFFEKNFKNAGLKYILKWTEEQVDIIDGVTDWANFNQNLEDKTLIKELENYMHLKVYGVRKKRTNKNIAIPLYLREDLQLVYNFIYNNNTRQQTEYTQELYCPWCNIDCVRLYPLLKHLKLCHARFNFTYKSVGSGARIDVTINDSYDGSYAGSPYDMAGPSGCVFARSGPVRRTPVTNLLVFRPRRLKLGLEEFLELDEDDLSKRPYITGHNRLYHNSETCLPINPQGLEADSESEPDPLWLQQKTKQMIDEFTDVNEGEKELMKLWNLHVMKHGFVGDCQVSLACNMFLEINGNTMILKNLYRNFILHLSSLFDYGLICADDFYKIVAKCKGMLSTSDEGREIIAKNRQLQVNYWIKVGMFRQEELKLKSPQKQPSNSNSKCYNLDNNIIDITDNDEFTDSPRRIDAITPSNKRRPTSNNHSTSVMKRSKYVNIQNSGADSRSAANKDRNTTNGGNKIIKFAVKKSACREDEVNMAVTREKRLDNGVKKSLNSSNSVTISPKASEPDKDKGENNVMSEESVRPSDSKGQLKRKLSVKDDPPLAFKRSRHDNLKTNNSNIEGSSIANSNQTRSSLSIKHDVKNSTDNQSKLTLSTRTATRRLTHTGSNTTMFSNRVRRSSATLRTRYPIPDVKN